MKRVAGLLALSVALATASAPCPQLRPVNSSECPEDFGLDPCDTYGLRDGDLCEGDGECGTSNDLDNCVTDDTRADIYAVVEGTQSIAAGQCPELKNITSEACPKLAEILDLRSCDAGHAIDDLCEGDGECGTDRDLNNCNYGDTHADVYKVVGFAPTPQPTSEPTSPRRGCPASKYVLVPVAKANCPSDPEKKSCNTTSLRAGDYCEAHGECDTDPNLNNCEYDSGDVRQDIYEVCNTKFDNDMRGIAKLFFKEECVAKLESSKFKRCPMEELDELLEEYLGGFRIESYFVSTLSMLGSISLIQLGGIIQPRSTFGLVFWVLCFLGFLLEFMATVLGIVMVTVAYILMRSEFRECMLPWAYGYSLMDVIALPSFFFVPPVLFRIALLAVTAAGLAEFICVLRACARVEKYKLAKADDAKKPRTKVIVHLSNCFASIKKNIIKLHDFLMKDNSIVAWVFYIPLYVVPLALFGLFCVFFIVFPVIFSLVLLIGVWPCLLLTYVVPCLIFFGIDYYGFQFDGKKVDESLKCDDLEATDGTTDDKQSKTPDGAAASKGSSFCSSLGSFTTGQIHAAFWWSGSLLEMYAYLIYLIQLTKQYLIKRVKQLSHASTAIRSSLSGSTGKRGEPLRTEAATGDGKPMEGDLPEGDGDPARSAKDTKQEAPDGEVEPFIKVVFFIYFFFLISPLVVYGSWIAAYATSKRYNTKDTMNVVTVIYSFTYQIFRGSINALKHMDLALNFRGLFDIQAAAAYLADLMRVDSFDAHHYVDGAKGMDALYLLISLCRSGVAYVARALALLSAFGLESAIEFHASAAKVTFKELAAETEIFGDDAVDEKWSSESEAAQKEKEKERNLWNKRGFMYQEYEVPCSPKSPEPKEKSACALS